MTFERELAAGGIQMSNSLHSPIVPQERSTAQDACWEKAEDDPSADLTRSLKAPLKKSRMAFRECEWSSLRPAGSASPSMRNVTFRQLRTFSAAMRSGSLSQAARLLNITPPAVTLQMQLLEEAVGLPLAERTPKGWRPTAAGLEVLAAAKRVQAALDDCSKAIERLDRFEAGRIVVAVTGASQYFATPLLAAFKDQYPAIDVELTVGGAEEAAGRVSDFEADVAILDCKMESSGLGSLEIGRQAYVVIAPAGNALGFADEVGLDCLVQERFAVPGRDAASRLIFENLFSASKPRPPAVLETGAEASVKQAVMANLGLAVIEWAAISLEVLNGKVSLVKAEGTPVWREIFAVRNEERRFSPAAQNFWEFASIHGLRVAASLAPPAGNKKGDSRRTFAHSASAG